MKSYELIHVLYLSVLTWCEGQSTGELVRAIAHSAKVLGLAVGRGWPRTPEEAPEATVHEISIHCCEFFSHLSHKKQGACHFKLGFGCCLVVFMISREFTGSVFT